MEHTLKTWPQFFGATERGEKTCEVRAHDRPFAVGDVLLLLEYDPLRDEYTGRSCQRIITHMLRHGDAERVGVSAGYVVLSVKPA